MLDFKIIDKLYSSNLTPIYEIGSSSVKFIKQPSTNYNGIVVIFFDIMSDVKISFLISNKKWYLQEINCFVISKKINNKEFFSKGFLLCDLIEIISEDLQDVILHNLDLFRRL